VRVDDQNLAVENQLLSHQHLRTGQGAKQQPFAQFFRRAEPVYPAGLENDRLNAVTGRALHGPVLGLAADPVRLGPLNLRQLPLEYR
jgi:hypothetical protein